MMAEVAAIARTVTIFIPPSRCNPISLPDALTEAVSQAKALRKALEDANITVQTTRLALHSPAVFHTPAAAIQAAKQIAEYDIDYFTLGNVFPKDEAFLNTAFFLTLLRETPAFISCTVAQGDTIFAQATHVAASVVMGAKQIPHGAFRFGALANVNPGSAFFPSAYAADSQSRGEPLHTCIGIQGASSLSHLPKKPEAAKQRVRDIVEILAARVVRACKPICDVTVDFSTAPFPGVEDSAARTVAHVGDSAEFGGSGYVAGAALLASALQTAEFQRGGLCGVMLPYAEDVCLAGGRRKSVGELLLASAVCGTGLDTIPIAGDTEVSCVRRVVCDVAAMSCRLGMKQLSVRLVPVVGKKAGEMTEFESEYMCNGPVLEVGHGEGGWEEDVKVDSMWAR